MCSSDLALTGLAADVVHAANASGQPIIAIDVPSGLHGDLGRPMDGRAGVCVRAARTVTFFRAKPAHFLMPGRMFCGPVTVSDIGIPEQVLNTIRPNLFANGPALWRERFPTPSPMATNTNAAMR